MQTPNCFVPWIPGNLGPILLSCVVVSLVLYTCLELESKIWSGLGQNCYEWDLVSNPTDITQVSRSSINVAVVGIAGWELHKPSHGNPVIPGGEAVLSSFHLSKKHPTLTTT